jgi:hypothetical protein
MGPELIRLGIALLANACASVLQIIKLHTSITWLMHVVNGIAATTAYAYYFYNG